MLGVTVSVLRVDDYYRDLANLSFEDRDAINFDHPDAIEFERLVNDLASLRSGEEVKTPVYDFTQHTRSALSLSVPPADIILLEGVLAMSNPAIRALVDYTIFVDTPLELCLARRIDRDAIPVSYTHLRAHETAQYRRPRVPKVPSRYTCALR